MEITVNSFDLEPPGPGGGAKYLREQLDDEEPGVRLGCRCPGSGLGSEFNDAALDSIRRHCDGCHRQAYTRHGGGYVFPLRAGCLTKPRGSQAQQPRDARWGRWDPVLRLLIQPKNKSALESLDGCMV